MTLQNFIDHANSLKQELKDKEIVIMAENGLLLTPKIKFITNNGGLELSTENVDKVIIIHE